MNRRKGSIIAVLSGLILSASFFTGCGPRIAVRRDYEFSRIKRVGVLKFDSSDVGPFSTYDPGNTVADEFVFQLLSRDIAVIERNRIENVLREQDLWTSGRIDPSTVRGIGKILGVDTLIIGTVTRYIPDSKKRFYLDDPHGGLSEEIFMVYSEFGLTARMVNVETGTVIWVGSYTYDSFYMESAIRLTVSALMDKLDEILPSVRK